MLDRLVIGLPYSDAVKVRVGKKLVRLSELPEHAVILSPFGGSSLTIAQVGDRLVIRCNPINFLTRQNWIGSSNVYALTHRVLAVLVDEGLVEWGRVLSRAIQRDEINVHELAFAMYCPLGTDMHRFTDLLKSCYGSVVQHFNPKHPIHVHLYQGPGAIVRTNDVSLTWYDKYLKTYQENPSWSHPIVDGFSEELRQDLRIECTVKYNWFGTVKRKLSYWRDADYEAIEQKLFADCLGKRFHLQYIMNCPNVFGANYTEGWSTSDRNAFNNWLEGTQLDARTIRRLYNRHGFDAGLSAAGHRNLLWSMFRPDCLRIPRQFDPSTINANTPGHRLFSRYMPLLPLLHQGANAKTRRRIDKLCGL